MKKMLLAGVTGLLFVLHAPVLAGGPGGGGPVEDPGLDPTDPTEPSEDPIGGTTGGGGTTTPSAPIATPSASGSGAYFFTLDNLPTGPSGTQAFYQPAQIYGPDFGNVTIDSAQDGLNQTVNGLTLSLRTATADYANGTGLPQTRIRVENDSSNFGYLGVPSSVNVGIEATTLSADAPGAIFANFDQAISYFSVDLYRLSGNFTVTTTLTAYSGLNGTGQVLGTIGGTVSGGNNYAMTLVQLANIGGARSVGLLGGSALANYNNITANVNAVGGVPEPFTWALMLVGFGLVGASLRRRNATADGAAVTA